MGDRPWKRQRLCDGDVVMLSPSPSDEEEEASDASPAPSTEASPQSEPEASDEAESEEEEEDVEYGEEIAALLHAAAARDGPAPVDPAYRAGTRAFHVVCHAVADADASPLLARVDAAVHAQRLDAWHLEARLRARARLPPLAALAGWRSAWPGRALDRLLGALGARVRPLRVDDGPQRLAAQHALGAAFAGLHNHLVADGELALLCPSSLAVLLEARAAWRLVVVVEDDDAAHALPRVIAPMGPVRAELFRARWRRDYRPGADDRFLVAAVLPRLRALRPLFFAWLVPRYAPACKEGPPEGVRAHAEYVLAERLPPAFWAHFQADLRALDPPSPPQAAVAADWMHLCAQHIECFMDAQTEAPQAHTMVALMWAVSAAAALAGLRSASASPSSP